MSDKLLSITMELQSQQIEVNTITCISQTNFLVLVRTLIPSYQDSGANMITNTVLNVNKKNIKANNANTDAKSA